MLVTGSGKIFLLVDTSTETFFLPRSRNLLSDWCAIMTSTKRGTDGAVHWNSKISSKLRDAFQTSGGQRFPDEDWLHHINERSNKIRFQYCENSKSVLLYFRAFQGHTGGNMTAPELMGHVAIPFKWKAFLVPPRMLVQRSTRK